MLSPYKYTIRLPPFIWGKTRWKVCTLLSREKLILIGFPDEELIKYAWPQDVWFHVDKLSSAHVYLRMPEGMSWENIPQALLPDCAQLVKANAIEGP